MTGIYVRIQRNGKWINEEVENLTEEELIDLFKNKKKKELINWGTVLIKISRPFIQMFDIKILDIFEEAKPEKFLKYFSKQQLEKTCISFVQFLKLVNNTL